MTPEQRTEALRLAEEFGRPFPEPGYEDLAAAAALLRELAAVPATWQPIETAPKDGRLFLCWVAAVRYGETDEGQQYQEDVSQVDFCNWRTQADIPDCGWFDPCCGQIGDQQGVTHWMPLPTAPHTAR